VLVGVGFQERVNLGQLIVGEDLRRVGGQAIRALPDPPLGAIRRLDLGRQTVEITCHRGVTQDLQASEKLRMGCGLLRAGDDPNWHVVADHLLVASENCPVLGTIEV